jgi:RNA polymerase sigma-70 factor, ECF subfamily
MGWSAGDDAALEHLTPLVHDELRRVARRHMAGERPGHTLQATALVNEGYLRLIDVRRVNWQDRAHFFAMAARLMRRILVDAARSRGYQKRGGDQKQVPLDDALMGAVDRPGNVVALDDALESLAAVDERKSRVVELRFFGGLSVEETAMVLKVSPVTVMRDWKLAKLWLLRELGGDDRQVPQRDGGTLVVGIREQPVSGDIPTRTATARPAAQARIFVTTSPCTSVRRKSRPWNL